MIAYQNFGDFRIGVVVEDGAITKLLINNSTDEYLEKETKLHRLAFKELAEYFAGLRTTFDLPLNPKGTLFQQQVWKGLQEIPYGHTASYRDIASVLKKEEAYRAVGNANGKNPIPIIIPCHRVIHQDGSLGGYTGGIHIKTRLLELERNQKHD